MNTAEQVIDELRARGELSQHASGLTALSGSALRLYHMMSRELDLLARSETAEEWHAPPALAFDTLARADYFASFPQWLTAVAQIDGSEEVLQEVADAPDPAEAAARALVPTQWALQPAVCYHVYAGLADTVLGGSRCISIAGTCWRREQSYAPLERQWAFTMRETVCLGTASDVELFRQRGLGRALGLAERLGIPAEVATATDPFFAPTARGRSLLQRIKALKQELLLPLGDGRTVAAASFNHHERFFGEAFNIGLRDGTPASSGCVAFGVERWVLAFLVAHGVEAADWPQLQIATSTQVASWV